LDQGQDWRNAAILDVIGPEPNIIVSRRHGDSINFGLKIIQHIDDIDLLDIRKAWDSQLRVSKGEHGLGLYVRAQVVRITFFQANQNLTFEKELRRFILIDDMDIGMSIKSRNSPMHHEIVNKVSASAPKSNLRAMWRRKPIAPCSVYYIQNRLLEIEEYVLHIRFDSNRHSDLQAKLAQWTIFDL